MLADHFEGGSLTKAVVRPVPVHQGQRVRPPPVPQAHGQRVQGGQPAKEGRNPKAKVGLCAAGTRKRRRVGEPVAL